MVLLYRWKSDFSSEGESCKGTCRGGGGYYGEEEGEHYFFSKNNYDFFL